MTLIKQERVFLNIEVDASNKEEALPIISQKISAISGLSATELAAGFEQREALSTTGFGSGFAIPHTKITQGEGLVAFFRFSQPIDWQAMDDAPVSTAVALVMPETDDSNLHLKMISKLARLLMHEEFIDTLNSLTTEAAISDYLNSKLED